MKILFYGVICEDIHSFRIWINENKHLMMGNCVIIPIYSKDDVPCRTLHEVTIQSNPTDEMYVIFRYAERRLICKKCEKPFEHFTRKLGTKKYCDKCLGAKDRERSKKRYRRKKC